MNTVTKTCALLFFISIFYSCKKSTDEIVLSDSLKEEVISAPPLANYWTVRQNFPGSTTQLSSVVVNNKAYVFGSIDGGWANSTRLWEYDPATNIWTEKAPMPTTIGRRQPATFAINNRVYFVGGIVMSGVFTAENWEYNPSTNSWTRKRDLPQPRGRAGGFAMNGKGYVVMGQTDVSGAGIKRADILEYSPVTNAWFNKSTLTDATKNPARTHPVVIAINDKAYIGFGWGQDYKYYQDWWEFDPWLSSWVRKADLPGGKLAGFSFAIGSDGYVGSGGRMDATAGEVCDNQFWLYSTASNTWHRKADVPGASACREFATGFGIGNYGYAGTGNFSEGPVWGNDNKFYRYHKFVVTGFSE